LHSGGPLMTAIHKHYSTDEWFAFVEGLTPENKVFYFTDESINFKVYFIGNCSQEFGHIGWHF
jgi:hypothetical protein